MSIQFKLALPGSCGVARSMLMVAFGGSQGGGVVGSAVGSAGVGAVALPGAEAGEVEDSLAGCRVVPAAFPGSGLAHPVKFVAPPRPGFAFDPVTAAASEEDAVDPEGATGPPAAARGAPPAAARSGAGQAGGGEPVKIPVELSGGVAKKLGEFQPGTGNTTQRPVHPTGVMSQPRRAQAKE